MMDLIKIIVDNLSDDLLKPKYRMSPNKNKYTGHCYVATETLYYLLPDKDKSNYTPAILKINGDTHWFLKNKINKTIIDITQNQYSHVLDYHTSRNAAFLTKNPSKRTLILINRIYENTGI